MKDTPEWRQEWLFRHKDADVIVTDLKGTPVCAEYRTLRGRPRNYPIAYSYPDDEGFNL